MFTLTPDQSRNEEEANALEENAAMSKHSFYYIHSLYVFRIYLHN